MSTNRKILSWVIIIVLLFPYLAYALTLLDASVMWESGGLLASLPFFYLYEALFFILRIPEEGMTRGIYLWVFYPVYSLIVVLVSYALINRILEKNHHFYRICLVIIIAIALSPLVVTKMSWTIIMNNIDKQDQALREQHTDLTIHISDGYSSDDHVYVPVMVKGLIPGINYFMQYELYYFSQKDGRGMDRISFQVKHDGENWIYDDYFKNIQKGEDIILNFKPYGGDFDRENLYIDVKIDRDHTKLLDAQYPVQLVMD